MSPFETALSDPPRGRRATSYDVAIMAGVAQSTVSRCFRDDSNISPLTRRRVMDAADRLGYMPNALARGLITQRSNMVAVVITRYTQRFNPDVIFALGESLAAAGKQLLLVTVEGDGASLANLRGALEYPLDGMISCVLVPDDDLRELLRRRLPIVFYNRQPERIPVDSVAANHFRAAADLADALHHAGHRRFLCVSGPSAAPVSQQRTEGFVSRLNALGAPAMAILETDYSYDAGRSAFLDYNSAKESPDAVFCANDQIAMGVMDACRFDLGWDIPRKISVVGFDDVVEGARPTYGLTTLRQDSVEMAHQAVRILLTRLERPDEPPVSAIVDAKLVIRQSARLTES